MGYLPGLLWILAGVVFAGAVQDFIILFISTRRDGRSLGDLIKQEMGVVPGLIALFGTFMIMIIILAVLALIVVKALADSPWGTFTVAATIPVALFMGVYLRHLRPGRIGEVSVIGFVLLMLAIIAGQWVHESPEWAPLFTYDGTALTWMLIAYGFIAASIPVWLLLAPRDYLSTFLKIGTIIALAIGIVIVSPLLQMPALTQFARWRRPGVVGQSVPVPVHHHRLRLGVGLPRADLVGHDAEDAGERKPCALHRLRRHAGRIVRRGDGAHRGGVHPARRLLRDEQPAGAGGHHARGGGASGVDLGLRDHARRVDANRQGRRRDHHPIACRRRADAGGGHGAHPAPGDRAARR